MKYKYHHKYRPRQTPQVKKAMRLNFKTGSRSVRRNFTAAGKTAGRAVIFIVIVAALFFAAKWTKKNFVEAEKFKIKKITAAGFVNVSENEFLEKLPVSYGDNIILSYAKGIGRRMKKEFPGIKSVKVERNISGEVNIKITERKPVVWRISDTGAPEGIDSENISFRLKPGEREIPEFSTEACGEEIRVKTVALINELIRREEKLYSNISKLYNVGEEIFMVLKDSSKVFWGRYDGEDIGPKISLLYSVINDSKTRFAGFEYIDLQMANEGRVVIMPKGTKKGGKNNGKT